MRYDEPLDGGEWLLGVLIEKAFRPGGGPTEDGSEVESLVRWSEVDSDVPVNQLSLHPCSICGQPARVAIFDLRSRRRTLLCECCRPRDHQRS
jgi:hypothetical protein